MIINKHFIFALFTYSHNSLNLHLICSDPLNSSFFKYWPIYVTFLSLLRFIFHLQKKSLSIKPHFDIFNLILKDLLVLLWSFFYKIFCLNQRPYQIRPHKCITFWTLVILSIVYQIRSKQISTAKKLLLTFSSLKFMKRTNFIKNRISCEHLWKYLLNSNIFFGIFNLYVII